MSLRRILTAVGMVTTVVVAMLVPTTATAAPAAGFVVSEAQLNQMFPSRNSFYTYSGLTGALGAYPGFANSGSDTVKKQEAAAFLANVSHETGGLVYTVEQNTANYPHHCDTSQSHGCPAGTAAYYGRGPIQLSWNFDYKAAGDALGIDLLNHPNLVQNDAAVSWKTGLWYWNTQSGPGTVTPHDAMVDGSGFGETIRSINGSIECNGGNPAQVQSRVDAYRSSPASWEPTRVATSAAEVPRGPLGGGRVALLLAPSRNQRGNGTSYVAVTGAWSDQRSAYVSARSTTTDRTAAASPGVASWQSMRQPESLSKALPR